MGPGSSETNARSVDFAGARGMTCGPCETEQCARGGKKEFGPRGGKQLWAEREQKQPSSTISPFPLFFSGFFSLFLFF